MSTKKIKGKAWSTKNTKSTKKFVGWDAIPATGRRARIQARIWQESSVTQAHQFMAGLLIPVTSHYQWRPQLRDPADEMVLEAAVNANAAAIITYNLRDFGAAGKFGVAVLNPEQAFRQFHLVHNRSPKS